MVKIFQIFFQEDQLDKLEYIPYYNKECTKFFEHNVIVDLIQSGQHLNCDYFGVVSYQLREKIQITKNSWRHHKNISNASIKDFTPEQFEKELFDKKPDVMSFQCHAPHDPISYANNFHPNFANYFKEIMLKIGFNWSPAVFDDVFYCNYFVAKPELYQRFVDEMLHPAMRVMDEMPELLYNSGYPKRLRDDLRSAWSIDHYPYHAFLCERMFSYFVHLNKFRCLHY